MDPVREKLRLGQGRFQRGGFSAFSGAPIPSIRNIDDLCISFGLAVALNEGVWVHSGGKVFRPKGSEESEVLDLDAVGSRSSTSQGWTFSTS